MFEGFGEAPAGSSAVECALVEPKPDFDSTYGVDSRHRRHGWRRGVARCAGDCSEPCSAVSVRPRPGHRRSNVHWWSRKPILTSPMESKAEIVARDGDGPARSAPGIALSQVRGPREGPGRVMRRRMWTG